MSCLGFHPLQVILVHGDEVIGDSAQAGGLRGACAAFKAWVHKTYLDKK